MPSPAFEEDYSLILYGTIYYRIVSMTIDSTRFFRCRILCASGEGRRYNKFFNDMSVCYL